MIPLLQVDGLRVWFPKIRSLTGRPLAWIKAVEDASFMLNRGETLALVGESGSGKTTTSLATLRALKPTAGAVRFCPDGKTVHELAGMSQKQLRPLRRHMQMVFQDPFASLNPRMTVQRIVSEPLVVNRLGTPGARRERAEELVEEVGLSRHMLSRYPHAFSGGQRQRIAIARALALRPALIVCDEPVSALDVSVQAQILNLMMDLKEAHDLAYLFIAHDLEVVRHVADRVAVMYAGRLVEQGTRDEVLDRPLHPYTRALLASSPKPDPAGRGAPRVLHGEVPDPSALPRGCVFHPRCPRAMNRCACTVPRGTVTGGRMVRCLLYEEGGESR